MSATTNNNFGRTRSVVREMAEQKIRDAGNNCPSGYGADLAGELFAQAMRFRIARRVIIRVLQRRNRGDLSRQTYRPRRRDAAQFGEMRSGPHK